MLQIYFPALSPRSRVHSFRISGLISLQRSRSAGPQFSLRIQALSQLCLGGMSQNRSSASSGTFRHAAHSRSSHASIKSARSAVLALMSTAPVPWNCTCLPVLGSLVRSSHLQFLQGVECYSLGPHVPGLKDEVDL